MGVVREGGCAVRDGVDSARILGRISVQSFILRTFVLRLKLSLLIHEIVPSSSVLAHQATHLAR